MIRPIVKDPIFLAQRSLPLTEADPALAQDLRDTLAAHRDSCVGLAANMIGELRRMIIIASPAGDQILLNPEILKASGCWEAEEGCLSHSGTRKTKRYRSVKVRYRNEDFAERIRTFTGAEAQILQHELDHCNGVLI